MNEYFGLHVILISNYCNATYSGMTPGFIKNEFLEDDIQIDLQRLCFNAGATFIKDSVVSLDEKSNKIVLQKHPEINFDILSINTGSENKIDQINFYDKSNCIFVRPISNFINQLKKIDNLVNELSHINITIIGGGVAAYEISLSLIQRYQKKVNLLIVSPQHLSEVNLNTLTINKIRNTAKNMGIKELIGEVNIVSKNYIILTNSEKIKSDLNIFSTTASSPKWTKESNLKIDKEGFILVNNNLQSKSNDNIFVSGDIASIENKPRSKSGVMAVRHGEILKENIFLKIQDKPLKNVNLQKNWLYLIGTLNQKAILNYYFLSFHSKWCWRLKLYIDKKFIKQFIFPNKTSMKKRELYISKNNLILKNQMYCQGCGSKVSKNTLTNFLKKQNDNLELSDSAIINSNSKNILQSIDHIKLFESLNPYDFGAISYMHSQNDILACGGEVKTFSVSLGIPFSENKTEEFYLNYFMRGILSESEKYKCVLASGHSYQSSEPGITITMNGNAHKLIKKNQAKEGDLIYLSKELGSGYLLSAYYKNSPHITAKDFKELLNYLKSSNYLAWRAAMENNCLAMTDISGFGLASHLGDICSSSNLSANIKLDSDLLINKNINLITNFKSTGFKNNYDSTVYLVNCPRENEFKNILYDPQTNGPMLIVINKSFQSKFEDDFFKLNLKNPLLIGNFVKKTSKFINIQS